MACIIWRRVNSVENELMMLLLKVGFGDGHCRESLGREVPSSYTSDLSLLTILRAILPNCIHASLKYCYIETRVRFLGM